MSLSQFSLVSVSKPSEAHLRFWAVGERLQTYLCTAGRFCYWSFGGISRRKSHDPWASRKNFLLFRSPLAEFFDRSLLSLLSYLSGDLRSFSPARTSERLSHSLTMLSLGNAGLASELSLDLRRSKQIHCMLPSAAPVFRSF